MIALHHSEACALIHAIRPGEPFGRRDRALLILDLHTGLRVSELVRLDVAHVAVNGVPRAALYVPPALAKGGRERTIPLNEAARRAVAAILAWNERHGFSVEPARPLFVSRKHQRMTVRAVQRRVKALRERVQLDVPATPHTLRHTFATRVLSCTGNLRVVQILLGHQRLSTVQIYTHPTREDMRLAVEAIAPVDALAQGGAGRPS